MRLKVLSKIVNQLYSWVLYSFALVFAYGVATFSKKTKDTLNLRRQKKWKDIYKLTDQKLDYWIHVASQGELEYALPLIEELQKRGSSMVVTYFSISAKESVEKLPEAYSKIMFICPVPHDGFSEIESFTEVLKQKGLKALLLIKYELWPGMIYFCKKNGIKLVLVNALKPSLFQRFLFQKLDLVLFAYEKESLGAFHHNQKVVGDSRAERVLSRMHRATEKIASLGIEKLFSILKQKEVLVCGSMWAEDTRVLFGALKELSLFEKQILFWVPHELFEKEILEVTQKFKSMEFQVYTLEELISKTTEELERVFSHTKSVAILVLQKGFLLELYSVATKAFVGGGFKRQVHSVMEPAFFGCYVACGYLRERSPESFVLEQNHQLTVLQDEKDLVKFIRVKSNLEKLQLQKEKVLKQFGVDQGINKTISGKVIDEVNFLCGSNRGIK